MADDIYYQLSRYTQPPLIILGTLGAVFNQILFSCRKPLRASSCSLYFRALSINDLLTLYIYVLLQWLVDQFGIDPTKQYNWYCKTKSFIQTGLYTLSAYFVVLACFDRLCTSSTNVRLRRVASVRVASYLIPSMAILIFAAYAHIPFYYMLVTSPTASFCISIDPVYTRIYAIFLVILLGVLPPVLMMVLCSITLILLRRQRRRVMPINQARLRQRDNQLLKMLVIYVAFHLICTIPFSIVLLIAVYQLSSPSATIILLFRLFVLLFNVSFSISFYVYTLGTPFYRHELCCLIKQIHNRFQRMMHTGRNQPQIRIAVKSYLERK